MSAASVARLGCGCDPLPSTSRRRPLGADSAVSHAMLAAGRVGEEIVTVLCDLGPHVLTWAHRLEPPELRRGFAAAVGPAVLDFVTFIVGSASHVELPREAMLQEIRAACGVDHDEQVLRAALFYGLGELGWNKALDAGLS